MNIIKELKEQTKDLTVLYVEDEEESRKQLLSMFKLFFKNIDVAVDGLDGLSKYDKSNYDLVITDITMPKMDGIEMSKNIKNRNLHQKIIVISAHDNVEFLLSSIEIGIDGYILKPINMNQISQTVLKVSKTIKLEKMFNEYYETLTKEIQEKTVELTKKIVTDESTGLFNRYALNEALKNSGYKTFLLLNIDSFDTINITYGYEVGDYLIKKIAKFFKAYNELENNKVYYLGADEFVILFKDKKIDEVLQYALNLKNEIDKCVFDVLGNKIKLTFSMAISDGENDLIKKAHIALRESRLKGKNRIEVYSKKSSIEILQKKIREFMPLIKSAIEKREFVPYFQPIVNSKTKKVEKFESLARLYKEDMIFSPAQFIDVAESTGLLPEITRIMIDKTFNVFKDNSFGFSINITEHDLKEGYLEEYLLSASQRYKILPSRVVIEVLEGISLNETSNVFEQLAKLKDIGFLIAIDDFGTEKSNFERVHSMNVDFIKIDGSFIKNIDTNEKSYSIAKTITNFSKSIGAKVVAEYVCSEKVFKKVKELGVDYSQGYYFGAPKKEIITELGFT